MYEDKTLICKECGAEFVFTAGEQEFYASKGFVNEPQRCKACRDARKNAAKPEREMFTAICASCGKEARVPFKPREDRPVYCSECFAKLYTFFHLPVERPGMFRGVFRFAVGNVSNLRIAIRWTGYYNKNQNFAFYI